MNISSIIIYINDQKALDSVLSSLENINEVEIVTHAEDRVVALISSSDVDGEIATFRRIEALPNVISVAMVYSYQEELESDMVALEQNIKTKKLSEILTRDDIDAKNVKYGGELPV